MSPALWAEKSLRREVGPGGVSMVLSDRRLRQVLELGQGRVDEGQASREMAEMLRNMVSSMSVHEIEVKMGKSLTVAHPAECSVCGGSGYLGGSCTTCGGTGRRNTVAHLRDASDVLGALERLVCPDCAGTGKQLCPRATRVVFTLPADLKVGWIVEGRGSDGETHYAKVERILKDSLSAMVEKPRKKGVSCGLVLAVALFVVSAGAAVAALGALDRWYLGAPLAGFIAWHFVASRR